MAQPYIVARAVQKLSAQARAYVCACMIHKHSHILKSWPNTALSFASVDAETVPEK